MGFRHYVRGFVGSDAQLGMVVARYVALSVVELFDFVCMVSLTFLKCVCSYVSTGHRILYDSELYNSQSS